MDIHVTCVCGRVYEKTEISAPVRNKGSFECECGVELERWNSSRVPSYRLIQHSGPEKHPK